MDPNIEQPPTESGTGEYPDLERLNLDPQEPVQNWTSRLPDIEDVDVGAGPRTVPTDNIARLEQRGTDAYFSDPPNYNNYRPVY